MMFMLICVLREPILHFLKQLWGTCDVDFSQEKKSEEKGKNRVRGRPGDEARVYTHTLPPPLKFDF